MAEQDAGPGEAVLIDRLQQWLAQPRRAASSRTITARAGFSDVVGTPGVPAKRGTSTRSAPAGRPAAPASAVPVSLPSSDMTRRTVSLRTDVAEQVDERVGPRGFSAYTNAALTEKLERGNALAYSRELLMDAPPTDAERARADERLAAAFERLQQ